jgi:uncharacterized OB-fold protein
LPEISEEPAFADVVAYSNFVVSCGTTGTKFLKTIRDEKKIMGIKCPSCSKVYVPPRTHCPTCFVRMSEWVDLDGKGTLSSYTVVRYEEPYQPKPVPFAFGVIQMNGADTGMVHVLGDVDLDKIEVGMALEPVFKEEREGSILDIDYFRPSS